MLTHLMTLSLTVILFYIAERCGGSPATVGLENVVAAEIVVRVTGLKLVPSFPFAASSSCPIFPRRRQTVCVCVALFIGMPFFFLLEKAVCFFSSSPLLVLRGWEFGKQKR